MILVERFSTERVNAETIKNLNNLRNTLNDIAFLTGQSTPEFVNRTEGRFQNYLEPAAQRGYNFVKRTQKNTVQHLQLMLSKQRGAVDDYLESYSNLNRPTFMAASHKSNNCIYEYE